MTFETTTFDSDLIERIVNRAIEANPNVDRMHVAMTLTAVHANGCPLRLSDLAIADDGNFGHDVFGMMRYVDTDTGQLTDCFLPRFAA